MYEGKVRVRASGLLLEEGKLLLVKLTSPATGKDIWMPPGGGVEPGESLKDALKREFVEETGLQIQVEDLVHINEFIEGPYHALEFFFFVKTLGGKLELGSDPEYVGHQQLLKEIGWFSKQEVQNIDVTPDYIKEELWKNDGREYIKLNFFE